VSKDLIKRILIGKSPRYTLIRAVIIAVFCIILFKFFLIPIRIHGKSMEPTYHDGSINFVNTLYYKYHSLKRGDVVAIAIGSGHRYMYLKRIVGLPGEKVSFKDGKLLIEGKIIYEPYIKYECDWDMSEILIGENEYFVVGDNRGIPIDTHKMGRVDKDKIVGKPLW
jgi:signal peptidase I